VRVRESRVLANFALPVIAVPRRRMVMRGWQ
jgi:hypothetical protein